MAGIGTERPVPIGTSANHTTRLTQQVGDDRAHAGLGDPSAMIDARGTGDDGDLTRGIDHELGVGRRQPLRRDLEGGVAGAGDDVDEVDRAWLDVRIGTAVVDRRVDHVASREHRGEQEQQPGHGSHGSEESHAEDLPHGAADATATGFARR